MLFYLDRCSQFVRFSASAITAGVGLTVTAQSTHACRLAATRSVQRHAWVVQFYRSYTQWSLCYSMNWLTFMKLVNVSQTSVHYCVRTQSTQAKYFNKCNLHLPGWHCFVEVREYLLRRRQESAWWTRLHRHTPVPLAPMQCHHYICKCKMRRDLTVACRQRNSW